MIQIPSIKRSCPQTALDVMKYFVKQKRRFFFEWYTRHVELFSYVNIFFLLYKDVLNTELRNSMQSFVLEQDIYMVVHCVAMNMYNFGFNWIILKAVCVLIGAEDKKQ